MTLTAWSSLTLEQNVSVGCPDSLATVCRLMQTLFHILLVWWWSYLKFFQLKKWNAVLRPALPVWQKKAGQLSSWHIYALDFQRSKTNWFPDLFPGEKNALGYGTWLEASNLLNPCGYVGPAMEAGAGFFGGFASWGCWSTLVFHGWSSTHR